MIGGSHIPVLLEEVMEYLDIGRKGVYFDCTIGLGGHALEILKRNQKSKVIGFDIDEQALLQTRDRLQAFADRVNLFHSDFRHLPNLDTDFSDVKGILLDLGLSSFQLDSPERGFSFNSEGPLDMRMDLRNKITASKILHKYSERRLAEIFRDYGELRQAKVLAREIVSRRKIKKLEKTTELRRIVEEVCRWRPQRGKIHPAAKVFQAIRIEVNQELHGLADFLENIAKKISAGARIIAISFHSLEDRIVKQTFHRLARPDNGNPILKILTKKPITPTEKEIAANSRARSAKLRAGERL
ncbi:MAG: 16S rRNA (cytosine(1402)-N(4))-methyltransferase RsmH [Candidatus Aminicenantes bacterium]|nr:MAG: 16S rRNA (cytosine(1402)-N(4))-methyltransferase RsmH [Candidatus Aminicenantes bacterium]